VSTWIEENIMSSTAFFGRVSLYLTLEELPLNDCNLLLDTQGFRGSIYEKFKLLAICGGIPWYLQQVQANVTADENIKNLCFHKDGLLFIEFDLIFHDLFQKRSLIYRPIVEALANGPKEYNQISSELKYPKSGALSSYLEDLIQSGFISRDYTWGIKAGKPSRLSHFRLSDNYLRFYFKCILPSQMKIQQDRFKDIRMDTLPGWRTIMGFQFENLVLKNRKEIWKSLGIKPEDIILDNPFFQRKTTRTQGCQIDYLIQTRFNTLFACEIKFSQAEINTDVIQEMKEKLMRFTLPRSFSCWPVLIHVNGVNENVVDQSYFSEIIDFSKFLEEKA
jgi:hypothetical protein